LINSIQNPQLLIFNKMKKVTFLFLSILTFVFGNVQAQDSCRVCKPYPWEIGIPIGLNQYFGDMHCSKPYASQNSLMAGVFVRRHINDYFSVRPQVLIGRLAGRDIDNPDKLWDYRRIGFKAKSFVEAAVLGEFYPLKERRFTCDGFMKKTLSPYIFGGIGAAYSNAKLYQDAGARAPILQRDKDLDVAHLAKFGNRIAAIIPVGLGLKYNVAPRFTLGAEAGYRFSTSDYLDGLSLAGNSERKDGYFLANVLGSYRFGDKDADKDGVVDKCDLCVNEAGLPKFQGCPDSDGDGVPDKDDECPTLAGPMGLKGCPDSDGDGIADKNDACPTLVGTAAMKGCPDKDFDGIADKDDACPEVAGIKELRGCPDTDGDGIADKDDKCPFASGPASLSGCPDSDGDGIADKDDDCLTVKGLASANGCPDSDGDGVPDNKDLCPSVPGLMTNQGCPEGYVNGIAPFSGYKSASGCIITSAELDELNFAAQNIEFFPGTNKIKPSSYKSLQRVCDVLNRCKDASLMIKTYNDGANSSQNLRLADLRACAIYGYFLKKKCISKSRMQYKGQPDEDLKAAYITPAGKKAGSRTEFILK
jgi:OmpA-OmpF porin, OOP family